MQPPATEKIQIFGIGNQNRGDDGAAWALLQLLEKEHFPAAFHYVYHLQIEHALQVASAASVLFVDATQEYLPQGFSWQPCHAAAQVSVFSHGLSPSHLLYITRSLYQTAPPAHLLLLQGENWDFCNALSAPTQQHIINAYRFLQKSDILNAGTPQ